jgi:hypothetical protein
MFYDLNVSWTDATRELQRTVAFLDECELSRAPAWWLNARWTDAVQ